MANTGISHEEAKSICDKLECSPSQSQASSKIYSETSHAKGGGGKKGKKGKKASF
jgi:hypothetical protein